MQSGTKQLSEVYSPPGDRHGPSASIFMISCRQRGAKGTGRMTFVPFTECIMLKPAYTSGGKTQLAFQIPTWRDQVLQRGKALFIFQQGKGACSHIQPSSLLCSLLIPFSAWGSTQVENLQGPGSRAEEEAGTWHWKFSGAPFPLSRIISNTCLARQRFSHQERSKREPEKLS